MQIINRSDF